MYECNHTREIMFKINHFSFQSLALDICSKANPKLEFFKSWWIGVLNCIKRSIRSIDRADFTPFEKIVHTFKPVVERTSLDVKYIYFFIFWHRHPLWQILLLNCFKITSTVAIREYSLSKLLLCFPRVNFPWIHSSSSFHVC